MKDGLIWLIAGGILAYLLGSFSSAVWMGKWFFGIDVRQHGSGNAGATNTIRVLGTKAGIVVMVIDILKAWIAVMIAREIGKNFLDTPQLLNYLIIAGALAVVGHVWPIFTGFKGGKGVASLVGVAIALYPPLAIGISFVWFVLVFIVTRYVSLASITSALLFAVLSIFVFPSHNLFLTILAVLIAVFVPYTHRTNISRLLKGEENKLAFKRKAGIK